MISNETFKIIISVGEMVDKFLVNSIKINKIKDDGIEELKLNNLVIKNIIKELTVDCEQKKLESYTESLMSVLEEQWDHLDIVLDEKCNLEERMKNALLAQNLNNSRVYWKNKINKLGGCQEEIKKYGS
jgi:hypothetical protein